MNIRPKSLIVRVIHISGVEDVSVCIHQMLERPVQSKMLHR